ncbi:MAG TPA: hypothetical protein VJB89_02215 [Candidatus Nanoarchaeia archaeon]|nr:hypothetical protein [Candidatus Nanoarchaeia archaeon]
MNANEQIEKLTEFIEENYKDEIYDAIQKGKQSLIIDFKELARYDHELAEELIQQPEEIIKAAEIAIEQIDLPEESILKRIRIKNLPETQKTKITDIRSIHLGKFISVEGIVRQASDIRPQVTEAKFECQSCGFQIKILQIDQKFKEPTRCTCGRKGASSFKLLSKELIDVQHLKIEESPEALSGGEQPKRLSVFVKEDLVESNMVKKTTPGSRILITGLIKEIPTLLKTGAQSIRYDIIMEANNVEATQEDFSEISLTRKDEEEIENFGKDPNIFNTLTKSIAPSIYGYEKIKLALCLQLAGGVKKIKEDGTTTRGDIHILLIGDPGSGKSQIIQFIAKNAPKARFVSGKGSSLDHSEPILIRENKRIRIELIGKLIEDNCKNSENIFLPFKNKIEALTFNHNDYQLEWKEIKFGYKHKTAKKLYHFFLETGRNIKVTGDHSIFVIKNGNIKCIKASLLKINDVVLVPNNIPFIEKEPLEKEMATLLGYFIAEGHMRNSKGSYKMEFTLNKNEIYIYNKINECSKKLFNISAKKYQHGENGMRVTIYRKEPYEKFKTFMENAYEKKAKEKRIPNIIFNTTKENQKAFINAYIEGDSGVTKSKYLMSDLLYLFLEQNILAGFSQGEDIKQTKIRDRIIKSSGDRFDLKSPHISKLYSNRYKNIPLEAIDKEIFKKYCKSMIKKDYKRFKWQRMPYLSLIERILFIGNKKVVDAPILTKKYGNGALEYFKENPKIYNKIKRGRTNYISLTNYGNKLFVKFKNLKKMCESGFGFCRIKSIKRINPTNKYVYDVSIPKFENFVGGIGGIICHNSGAGLTAAVIKDEFLRGWSLEAGALVLANKGIAVVDELDKMTPEDRSALHEALEQQSYHPDFKITFSNGNSKKIGEFVDKLIQTNKEKVIKGINCEILNINNYKLLSTDFNKIFETNIAKVSRHIAPNEFIKIEFSNKQRIVVTSEHPIFIFQKEGYKTIPANELKEGYNVPSTKNNRTILNNMKIKKISKIKNKGIKWVYDVTIEPNHTFISNGMILHNTVTISKANIQASLRAETTLLAAANPKGSRFDPYTPIPQQIDLPPTLLNRFDLIFPIRDIPDKERDAEIAIHVLETTQIKESYKDTITSEFLKKYISYIKQRIKPTLTKQAINEIKNFYVSLRNSNKTDNQLIKPIPISARQLEGLIRLTEASARLRLSTKATKEDAERAISLLTYCLTQVGMDPETGQIDQDRISGIITASTRNKMVIIKEILNKLNDAGLKTVPIEEIFAQAIQKGLSEDKTEQVIEQLKKSGEIFEPKKGFIQKI